LVITRFPAYFGEQQVLYLLAAVISQHTIARSQWKVDTQTAKNLLSYEYGSSVRLFLEQLVLLMQNQLFDIFMWLPYELFFTCSFRGLYNIAISAALLHRIGWY
jgi:hypothetical protein